MAITGPPQTLTVITKAVRNVAVLDASGVLDSSAYRPLRDKIIQVALEEPAAVVIDVNDLTVADPLAWLVFTSARWHIHRWPNVPLALICSKKAGCAAAEHGGVTRYVPVYPTLNAALEALPRSRRIRHRARADLPAKNSSLQRARELVAEWLTAWSQYELIAVTQVVVTSFIENVLQHTDSRPQMRLEVFGTAVAVVVQDSSHAPAEIREPAWERPAPASSLRIVSALCRTWGNAPTSTGKAVWALIGPENRL